MRIETSISIAAPPERIWPALADVAAWPDWLPTVTRVEPLDGRELAPGRRYRIAQPRLQTAVWTVTALATLARGDAPSARAAVPTRSQSIRLCA